MTQHWYRQATTIDSDGLWKRAVPTRVGGIEALRLSTEDKPPNLCLHTALYHGLAHARGNDDILNVLRQRDNVDWAEFTKRAVL